MKERPILFSTEMVRAILDGRKTQTRRVVKPQPVEWPGFGGKPAFIPPLISKDLNAVGIEHAATDMVRCPYGVPGDRLWVRETWQHGPEDCVYYLADNDPNENGWRPSIHMPRWASRILLEVTDVRVQRVQEITEWDAITEGVPLADNSDFDRDDPINDPRKCHVAGYMKLWDSINAKRGYPWQSNPWVWAITFKVVKLQKGRAK